MKAAVNGIIEIDLSRKKITHNIPAPVPGLVFKQTNQKKATMAYHYPEVVGLSRKVQGMMALLLRSRRSKVNRRSRNLT